MEDYKIPRRWWRQYRQLGRQIKKGDIRDLDVIADKLDSLDIRMEMYLDPPVSFKYIRKINRMYYKSKVRLALATIKLASKIKSKYDKQINIGRDNSHRHNTELYPVQET